MNGCRLIYASTNNFRIFTNTHKKISNTLEKIKEYKKSQVILSF